MKILPDIFKALGDPTRMRIVEMLVGKELCVCDILDSFNITQPVISHHLKILKHAGLVTDSREGKWVYYSLDHKAFELIGSFIDKAKGDLHKKERQHACLPIRK
ncbi:ArsR/SmtB family transcription factor [Dendrosporobacter sp. 1207_IL3150]|uniref:ArsR/SmtB family transcription factor n=1 Tax=Dendrosporobacter sp. 1207_IL3150 TaxID=3084054 RepID=UPI002FDADC3C